MASVLPPAQPPGQLEHKGRRAVLRWSHIGGPSQEQAAARHLCSTATFGAGMKRWLSEAVTAAPCCLAIMTMSGLGCSRVQLVLAPVHHVP